MGAAAPAALSWRREAIVATLALDRALELAQTAVHLAPSCRGLTLSLDTSCKRRHLGPNRAVDFATDVVKLKAADAPSLPLARF
jgi:hypothetical protein